MFGLYFICLNPHVNSDFVIWVYGGKNCGTRIWLARKLILPFMVIFDPRAQGIN
jgi:hypothetical protein